MTQIVKNGKLLNSAVQGISADKLKLHERAELGAVLAKSSAGKNMTPGDLRTVISARKATGLSSKTTSGNPLTDTISAMERALRTAKSIKP